MEENKYYKPSINEFYVGFEFEHFDVNKWVVVMDFNNHFINDDTNTISEVKWELAHNRIRVKYICREDIESLGFKESHFSNIDSSFFKLEAYTLYCDFNTRRLYIQELDGGNNIMLFQGFVKNKSELVKILKMTGIC